jgi:hypothetical protein
MRTAPGQSGRSTPPAGAVPLRGRLLLTALFLLPALLPGCTVSGPPPRGTFTNAEGITASDQQVAILETIGIGEHACVFCIEGISREDGSLIYTKGALPIERFKLVPGTYIVDYFYKSSRLRRPERSTARTDAVELKAGHTYTVKAQPCLWAECPRDGKHVTVWIEDAATADVVAGVRWYTPRAPFFK